MSYGYNHISYTFGNNPSSAGSLVNVPPHGKSPDDKIPQHLIIGALAVMVQQNIINKNGVSSWGLCSELFIDDLSGRNVVILRENLHKVVSKLYPNESWPKSAEGTQIFNDMMHNTEISMLDRYAADIIAQLQSCLVTDEVLTLNFMTETLNGLRNPFHVLTIRQNGDIEVVENTTVLTSPLTSLARQIAVEGSEDNLLFFLRPKDIWVPKEKGFTTQIDITLMFDGGLNISHVKGE